MRDRRDLADQGYHAAETLELADALNFRTYLPERKRPRWTDKAAEFQRADYANRRRLKRAKSRKFQRLHSERGERTFAHVCDAGGMRRSWMKNVVNATRWPPLRLWLGRVWALWPRCCNR